MTSMNQNRPFGIEKSLGAHLTETPMVLVAEISTLTLKAFTVLLWHGYGPNMQYCEDALNREEHV